MSILKLILKILFAPIKALFTNSFFLKLLAIAVLTFAAFIGFTLLTHDFTSRAEADQKLAQACLDATKIYLKGKAEITEFTGMTFGQDPFLGKGYRMVSLGMIESNEEYDKEKKYTCTFSDDRPWWGYSYHAQPVVFNMDKEELIVNTMSADDTRLQNMVTTANKVLNLPE